MPCRTVALRIAPVLGDCCPTPRPRLRRRTQGQSFNWQSPGAAGTPAMSAPMLPSMPSLTSFTNPMMPALAAQAPSAGRPAPLARLIVNPDQTAGAPPYALTDQTGTVQRYVDPVPEIDLDSYVGQIVSVRNDTGQTLLASQLELPRQSLYPMVGESAGYAPNPVSRPYARPSRPYGVEQVQYVDNDDSSVQLLPDGTVMAGGMPPQGQIPMMGEQYPGSYGSPMMPGEMCGPNCDPQFADPMQCGPGCMPPGGPMMARLPANGRLPRRHGLSRPMCSGGAAGRRFPAMSNSCSTASTSTIGRSANFPRPMSSRPGLF